MLHDRSETLTRERCMVLRVVWWVMICAVSLAGCDENIREPEGVLAVELEQLEGVWFDIAHLEHPLQEDCRKTRSLYNEIKGNSMSFIFECQHPDDLWYRTTGKVSRHGKKPDLLVFDFDEGFFDQFLSMSYWILAADWEAEWMAAGNPDEGWFWLFSRGVELDTTLRESILEDIDERGLYGKRFLRNLRYTEH